jgi:hypothetical protein
MYRSRYGRSRRKYARRKYARMSMIDGSLAVEFSYNDVVKDKIKFDIPTSERSWEGEMKAWLVHPKHASNVKQWIEDEMGISVQLPLGLNQGIKTVQRKLEVLYIGRCKERPDGETNAFGYSDGSWNIIFPESVLMDWFNAAPTQKAPTQAGTLYGILGITKSATDVEIKKAFRRMVRQWHPDVCQEPDAAEQFMTINKAYEVIGDPVGRLRYDAGLALEQSLAKSEKTAELWKIKSITQGYRSPLRCGLITAMGQDVVGRFNVEKILQWHDIVENGRTLVVSWPRGAELFVQKWI